MPFSLAVFVACVCTLIAVVLLTSCVVYERDPAMHHQSGVVVVNDPYCDDVGVKGWWCTEEKW